MLFVGGGVVGGGSVAGGVVGGSVVGGSVVGGGVVEGGVVGGEVEPPDDPDPALIKSTMNVSMRFVQPNAVSEPSVPLQ